MMQSLDPTLTLQPASLKRWSVQDYYRMSELGILDGNERTELIAGQIVLMAAKGTSHVISLHLLANTFEDQLGNTALIRTQDPIRLNDFSEPEPDLALVKGDILDYTDHHPDPEEIYLIVEVADSTLKKDCENELPSAKSAGFQLHRGLPQHRLTSKLWSYIPSIGRVPCPRGL